MTSTRLLERTEAVVPPLRHGDRLSSAEFLRRYEAMPELRKAELIDGVVYLHDDDAREFVEETQIMSSLVSHVDHGGPSDLLHGWRFMYRVATPGVVGAIESTLRLDPKCALQPDGCLYILPESGGRVLIGDDGYLEGAPDLVTEVSASSASRDTTVKFDAYRRGGVREYLIWRTRDREVDWFTLNGSEYIKIQPDADGVLKSLALPGLWLDPNALIMQDVAAILRALQAGLASPEHAAFVERLRIARAWGGDR